MFCPNCGARIDIDGARFCSDCGEKLDAYYESDSDEARLGGDDYSGETAYAPEYDDADYYNASQTQDSGSTETYEDDSDTDDENYGDEGYVEAADDHDDECYTEEETDNNDYCNEPYSQEPESDYSSSDGPHTEEPEAVDDEQETQVIYASDQYTYDEAPGFEQYTPSYVDYRNDSMQQNAEQYDDQYDNQYNEQNDYVVPKTFFEKLGSDRRTRNAALLITVMCCALAVLLVFMFTQSKDDKDNDDESTETSSTETTAEGTGNAPEQLTEPGADNSSVTQPPAEPDKFQQAKEALLRKSADCNITYTPINYAWRVQPDVSADDIQMVVRERPTYDNGFVDYNSIGKYKYDRAMLIKQNGKYGLIAFNGLPLCDVYFTSVTAGYDTKYILQRPDKNTYYSLKDNYEQERLNDMNRVDAIRGKRSDNETLIWSEADGRLIDGWSGEQTAYAKSSAAWFTGAFYAGEDYFTDKILVTEGRPIDYVRFEDAGCFCDGVIPVKLNGKWGYVDESLNVVLPFEFEETYQGKAYNVTGELIVAKKNGQYALFDLHGNKLIDFGQFDQMRPAYKGMIWVKDHGKWGVISTSYDSYDIQPSEPYSYNTRYTSKVSASVGLRLRQNPDTDSAVLGILSNHREVEVLALHGDWAYIKVNSSATGWVNTEFLK